MPLTALDVKNAKPRDKRYRLADGHGLYLEVMPTGARYWRMKYRFGGKEKRLALGVFPGVSLVDARDGVTDARALLKKGIDPTAQRKSEKLVRATSSERTFELVAREWLTKQTHMAKTTFDKAKWTLETHAFPWLGAKDVREIEPPELLAVLRRLESRKKLETTQRLFQRCNQVFRYAIATGRATRNPCADLRGALATPKTVNHAAITEPKKIGELLRAIDGYTGNFVTLSALKLSPLVFMRPGEVRSAEWSEIDLDRAEWRIPAAKMKMRAEHVVPLSTQAVALLKELEPLTGKRRFVFPSLRTPNACMSDGTVTAALRRLGYSGSEMTAHGFRAMASTRLNEMGWSPDVIERQLAHAERSKVRAAYNRASYMDERKRMMQAWADYLDGLRKGGDVVAIRKKSGASR
jgi:integrase